MAKQGLTSSIALAIASGQEALGLHCLGPSYFSSWGGNPTRAGCVSGLPELSRALERKAPSFPSGTERKTYVAFESTQTAFVKRERRGVQAVCSPSSVTAANERAQPGLHTVQLIAASRDRRRQDMKILPCMTNATVLEQTHHAGRQQEAGRPGPRNLGLRQTNIIRWYEPCEPCVVLEGNELLSVAPGPKGDLKSPSQIYRINERLRLFCSACDFTVFWSRA